MSDTRMEFLEFVSGPKGGDQLRWAVGNQWLYVCDEDNGEVNHWYQRAIDPSVGKYCLMYRGERLDTDGPPEVT